MQKRNIDFMTKYLKSKQNSNKLIENGRYNSILCNLHLQFSNTREIYVFERVKITNTQHTESVDAGDKRRRSGNVGGDIQA